MISLNATVTCSHCGGTGQAAGLNPCERCGASGRQASVIELDATELQRLAAALAQVQALELEPPPEPQAPILPGLSASEGTLHE